MYMVVSDGGRYDYQGRYDYDVLDTKKEARELMKLLYEGSIHMAGSLEEFHREKLRDIGEDVVTYYCFKLDAYYMLKILWNWQDIDFDKQPCTEGLFDFLTETCEMQYLENVYSLPEYDDP